MFAKVNTEVEQDLAAACEIRSIPTLMIFRQKILLFAQPGALAPHDLDAVLDQVKDLDMEESRRRVVAGRSAPRRRMRVLSAAGGG